MRTFLPVVMTACAMGATFLAGSASATSFCGSFRIVAAQPADLQSDVPVNAQVRIHLQEQTDDCGPDYHHATVTLLVGNTIVPTEVSADEIQADGKVLALVPAQPLSEGTTYTVRVEGDGETTTHTFTTGTGTAAPPAGAPTVVILSTEPKWWRGASSPEHAVHDFAYRITPAEADPMRLSLVRLYDQDGVELRRHRIGSADPIADDGWLIAPEGSDVCITVSQENAAGDAQSSTLVCAPSASANSTESSQETTNSGCQLAPGRPASAPIWFAAFAVGLGMMARRLTRRRARDARSES